MGKENEWSRVDQTIGREAREMLNRSSVTVVGLGGLGCETVRLLAMNGVGKFRLVDQEYFEKQNINRHPGSWEDVGHLKGEVARRIIKGKNPNAIVEAIAADVRYQKDIFKGTDALIVSGLGSNSTQEIISNSARKEKSKVVVSGVYNGGDAGEIFYIDPYQGPCYSCFTIASGLLNKNPEGIISNPYGIPEDQIEAAVGLVTDISHIAAIAAVSATNILLNKPLYPEDERVNMIIFANRKTDIPYELPGGLKTIGPWESMPLILPKIEGCPNCSLTKSDILFSDVIVG